MPNDLRPHRFLPLLILLAALLLSSLACTGNPFLGPTATPTATTTPTATLTPTPTPTSTVTLTPTKTITPTVSYLDWPVIISESFDDISSGWYTGPWSTEYVTGMASITGGKYHITITVNRSMFWKFIPVVSGLRDFFISLELQSDNAPEESNYGLLFREENGDYYYFCINADSRMYDVFLLEYNQWSNIIHWTSSERIVSDGPNTIAVKAEGSLFTFFINGKEVDQMDDDTLRTGRVGVGISLEHPGDTIDIEYDNVEVRIPSVNF